MRSKLIRKTTERNNYLLERNLERGKDPLSTCAIPDQESGLKEKYYDYTFDYDVMGLFSDHETATSRSWRLGLYQKLLYPVRD